MPIDRAGAIGRSKPLTINGRFLTQPVSGVQRFAREIVTAWDALLDAQPADERRDVALVHPAGAHDIPHLRHIAIREAGRLTGHAWEQVELPWLARDRRLVALTNAGPIAHHDSIVVIHDAAVFDVPESFAWRYRTLHRTLGRMLARRARIATVSRFSAERLTVHLGIDRADIAIIPNGIDTMATIAPNEAIIDRLGLCNVPYFLAFGSGNPRKNIAQFAQAFARLDRPDARLVLVGGGASGVFASESLSSNARVIAAGQCSDTEIAALYDHARALVFPSRYEGFGLPPLEALARGCPAIVSDIAPHREVCGDAATYVALGDATAMVEAMAAAIDRDGPTHTAEAGRSRASAFSWDRSARALAALA